MRKIRAHNIHGIVSCGKRKMQWANFEDSKQDQIYFLYAIHIRHKKNKEETYVQKPPRHYAILYTPVYGNYLKFLFRNLSRTTAEQLPERF